MAFDLSKIKNVVVLTLENRSFDQMLGDIPGVNGNQAGTYHGGPAWKKTDARVSQFRPDAPHGLKEIEMQVHGTSSAPGVPQSQGYVQAYRQSHTPEPLDPEDVLKFYPQGLLPVTHFLAKQYAVCDRWFCSVPASTMPNRMYAMCGDSGEMDANGNWKPYVHTPIHDAAVKIPSIFDLLPDDDWRIYSGGLAMPLILGDIGQKLRTKEHMRSMSQFKQDCHAGSLRRLSWIEPSYDWMPNPNDDHPPTPVEAAQRLIHDIYNALAFDAATTPSSWPQTVLVITYDEHGGFYDHELPPAIPASARSRTDLALNPDTHRPYFETYGPRVPAIVVSGFLKEHTIFSKTLEHCSLLKFLCEWRGLDASKLSARVASPETVSLRELFDDHAGTAEPHVSPLPPPIPLKAAAAAADAVGVPREPSGTEEQARQLRLWLRDNPGTSALQLPVLAHVSK